MKQAIFLIIVSFFIACSSPIRFAPSIENDTPMVIASPDQITVYRTDIPDFAYKEIGVVYYPGGSDLEGLMEEIKAEASKRGGNAIIDLDTTPNSAIGTIVIIEETR